MRFNGSHLVIAAVLTKLGIDPLKRINELDQDAEYTACRSEELPRYLELYSTGDCTSEERASRAAFFRASTTSSKMDVLTRFRGRSCRPFFMPGRSTPRRSQIG